MDTLEAPTIAHMLGVMERRMSYFRNGICELLVSGYYPGDYDLRALVPDIIIISHLSLSMSHLHQQNPTYLYRPI